MRAGYASSLVCQEEGIGRPFVASRRRCDGGAELGRQEFRLLPGGDVSALVNLEDQISFGFVQSLSRFSPKRIDPGEAASRFASGGEFEIVERKIR